MASKPRVSVVVIFLDEERFLPDAVESVLAQTFTDWELVLVDDGSSDRSAAIAREYAERDPRIRYITHPGGGNRGMSASRNRGVTVSSGELVAFLDGDDVWLPEKLEEQVALMEKHPEAGLIYGRTQWWFSWSGNSDDAQRDYLYDPGVALDTVIGPYSLLLSLIVNDGTPPYTCSLLVRRSTYERLGGFEESFRGLFEDQAFFAKAFLDENVYVSSRCWDRYRQHDESACAVGLQTGDLHPLDLSPSRRAFLEWLDGYLEARGMTDPALRGPLAAELEPYRYPAAPVVVESVEVSGNTAPELLGCAIDLPAPGARTGGRTIHIMGWALGEPSHAARIELRAGDSVIGGADVRDPRPDLIQAFPDVPNAGRAGFRTSVSPTGMAPLEFEALAVLEDGTRVKLASFRAARVFREEDAERGYPLVSVVIFSGEKGDLSATIETVRAQTYPHFEVVVAAEDPAVREVTWAFPGVRFVRCGSQDWQAAGTKAARGALVMFLTSRDRLHPSVLEAGVRALADSPGAARAVSIGAAEHGGLTLHHRFTLAAPAAERDRLPSVEYEPGADARGNGSGTGTTLILMYHRVGEPGSDPWGLAVSPARFSDQLAVLASNYDVVPLERCLEPSRGGRRVVVTFDDGYADNLPAARALATNGLPATFFLAAALIGSDREFWWDELERIVLGAPALPDRLELEIGGRSVSLGIQAGDSPSADGWRATKPPSNSRQIAYLELYRYLDRVGHEERDRLLDRLAELAKTPRTARPEMRPLTHEEAAELAAIDGMNVGAHTLTHPRLARLSASDQRDEIVGGRRRLEEIVGLSVESFAYPHGTRADYTPETVAIVAEAGFQRACIAEGQAVPSSASRFELPRLMVENWDADELERSVRGAFETVMTGTTA